MYTKKHCSRLLLSFAWLVTVASLLFTLLLYLASLQLSYYHHSSQNDAVICESDDITHLLKSLQWLFFWLWVKDKIIQWSTRLFHDLANSPSLILSLISLPLNHSDLATLMSLLFIQHTKLIYSSGLCISICRSDNHIAHPLISRSLLNFRFAERLFLITIFIITTTTPPSFPTFFLCYMFCVAFRHTIRHTTYFN